ncbi:NAD-dependent epimerase/dehydratase family protein [Aureitalea sp. L0-47]|uniref:NAD-dependent epimerase/dehydratase family protein n=1 Tax=Aureitalea sp. L0-47 TaxID=2816962 RepID=UPI0022389BE0|nr:NAD-dependent epimerase/dehydratase family protein [Aureitalea sp. L0-47]MCW5518441.1 NAD-dependent epimerase/dehydratase family protein [Aureitalea sp. L0-47]
MVLVTGGTGLVGSHLLYFLLKKGFSVRATHRRNSNLDAVRNVFGYYTEDSDALYNKIEWVEANITDIPALEDAFQGVTQVYHSAAYISFHPRHFQKLKKANVEGTANVVNMCLKHDIQKLCHVSSIATLGSTLDGSLISEKTAWNPEEDNNVYAITKYGAEMEVWRGTQEGLEAVIVNPAVILGSGYWNSGSGAIVKMAARGNKYYTSGGVAIVDVQDVVHVMMQLMESDICNEQYILASENLHYKEMMSSIANAVGAPAPTKLVAKWKLNLLRKLDWLNSKLTGARRKLLKATVNSMYNVSFYDGSKVTEHLNFQYTPASETIERVGVNFRKK